MKSYMQQPYLVMGPNSNATDYKSAADIKNVLEVC